MMMRFISLRIIIEISLKYDLTGFIYIDFLADWTAATLVTELMVGTFFMGEGRNRY